MKAHRKDRQKVMLITGANGFIGSRLTALAIANEYVVKTLSRSEPPSTQTIPKDQHYRGSLPDHIPVEALMGTDVVVHCAAWTHGGKKIARAINVDGTIRMAELAKQEGVETFIFISSQSARPDAIAEYGKTKYEAEQALLSMNGVRIVILRPGLVIGPGSTGLYRRLSLLVESLPVLPLLGGGRSIVQPIHVDDLCAAIFRCDQMSRELHKRVLSLGHPQGVTLAELLQAIALARLGRGKPAVSIPLWPVQLIVRVAETLGVSMSISSGNLKGLKMIEKMDTQADMACLNITARPLAAMLRNS